jgi:transcriptional antiterminator RfaH
MRNGFTTYAPRIKHRGRIGWLFPTYVFVRAWSRFYPILWTTGVVRLLMCGEQPASLADDIIANIRKREIGGFVKLPPPARLKKGQRVRIVRGSFAGQVAVYEGMTGKDRERVLLDLLGQKVSVELPDRDLEPLGLEKKHG